MAAELCSPLMLGLSTKRHSPLCQNTSHFSALSLSKTSPLFVPKTATRTTFRVFCKTGLESAVRVGQDRLLKVPTSNIRNFSIIAHIDHGKSTLADKLLQLTGTVQKREMKEQFLDNMDLERERGITIKLQNIPLIGGRVCLHNMAKLAKEATIIQHVLEPLFHYFGNGNLWSLDSGLAFLVLKDMQLLVDNTGQNTCSLLSILIKHLDHKHVLKQPNMQLDIMEVTTSLAQQAKAARMRWVFENEPYCLNLIDTPGHVDFSYEVSRSLAACEGALLVVDASQGVEAQTLANVYLALENNLEIIPNDPFLKLFSWLGEKDGGAQVLNKIDLPGAEPERVIQEIEEVVGLDCSNAILCSAKEGIGINEILNAVVERIPPPSNTAGCPLRALIFDSYYDPYRGVIVYFRVVDGTIKKGDRINFMASEKDYIVDEIGVLSPNQLQLEELQAGEVGYLSASIRSVADARVGDTITHFGKRAEIPLPGYEEATPMVFCGMFPVDADQFQELRDALEKLQLNDAALKFEPETSNAMGFGFRCGFLGLLHMEIVQERLEREYNLSLITTAPSVVYRVNCINGDTYDSVGLCMTLVECSNPSLLPEPGYEFAKFSQYQESLKYSSPSVTAIADSAPVKPPIIQIYSRRTPPDSCPAPTPLSSDPIEMLTPKDYIGSLMELSQDRRGKFMEMKFITEIRASITYELPLAEMVGDFFDQLKSRSKGYASMEYAFIGYKESELIKLDILINGDLVEPLATIVHKDKAYAVGRALTQKLKELIPRQMFKVPIQACIGSKVIASEALSAIRKDVLAKCYGGDISRKKKLLKKQAEGKKRMKAIGKVDVPQEAFMAVLKLEKEVL
ncbi:hypothetical protein JRO89_XS08G0251800 [Xanthoceras sorbifolium]|uniref:Translation factor GUF1 homolog, mitochondrial n=1 Tax=Xanthoceras sorbifolium TaxID=99658 RepID=A0ABQ8HRD5_9ROSI|nr:hypothetical protein JRO89_XS08G0251800 [Xanthoceras sorbifolium]